MFHQSCTRSLPSGRLARITFISPTTSSYFFSGSEPYSNATPIEASPAWLVDWSGKLVKTVTTQSRNTSGMAYGDGCVWMGANSEPYGIFQVDQNSKQLSHRQIPLSIDGRGGGTHGVKWHKGKLWIAARTHWRGQ